MPGTPITQMAAVLNEMQGVESSAGEALLHSQARLTQLALDVDALVPGEGPFEVTTPQIEALKAEIASWEARLTKVAEALGIPLPTG